ncbi:MAG: DNA cytosine methyltransferase [Elusimicrobiota bacterium]|jgi:DNA (cytosine-5)-methyltransferase 1|nr:DNA cytosine methyltransferase [Elusimicrobiota bacterium]
MRSKKIEPRVLSLFSGCGGLDLGFHKAGYKTIWANDINEWAVQTFTENFGKNIITQQDIEHIFPEKDSGIPVCDLIIGGFPCQDFSVVWKQPGFKGGRGNLYKHYLRFINAKKPRAFVAENVKGLLTTNKGKAIEEILKGFSNAGDGYMVKIQLYNFADYGVPQLRERVIIVGIRLDTGFNFIHPAPTHGEGRVHKYKTAGEALKDVEKVADFNREEIKIAEKTRKLLDRIPEGGNFKDIPADDPEYVKGMISHVYRRIKRNEPSKTIIAAGGGGTWGYHYPEPRPLCNRERARLQSFPDDYQFKGSVTEIRRQIGNAVPPDGVVLLAQTLKPLFENNYKKTDLNKINKKLHELSLKERLEYDLKFNGSGADND